jgi:uncharacterized protein (TIGR02246 family)
MYAQGRDHIIAGHQFIFATVYAGSVLRCVPLNVRLIRDSVALMHIRALLDVPSGPMAGEHEALPSAILTHQDSAWKITGFHNTFVVDPPFPVRP